MTAKPSAGRTKIWLPLVTLLPASDDVLVLYPLPVGAWAAARARRAARRTARAWR